MKKYRKGLSLIVVCCLLMQIFAVTGFAVGGFTDVPATAWYCDEVAYVYENGLMNGINATNFKPKDSLTRAMFVTILGRMENVDKTAYPGTSFHDVPTGKWYSAYVEWASQTGIVDGYGGGRFGTQDPVTREQMATMIARYLSVKGVTLPDSEEAVAAFLDAGKVARWAKDGLELMRRTGLINGDKAGNFRPKDTASRAEAAAIFMRLHQAVQEEADVPVGAIDLGGGSSIYHLTEEHIVFDSTEMICYVDNILLVYLKSGLTQEYKEQLAQTVGGRIAAELSGPVHILQIEVASNTLNGLSELAEKLERSSGVYYATYDVPVYDGQIALDAADGEEEEDPTWWYEAVEAGYVKEYYSDLLDSVTVGVVDGGVQSTHEELNGKITFGSEAHEEYNQELLDHNSKDNLKHGTHVSGIIAAADDGTGSVGIAPNAQIVFASHQVNGGDDMGEVEPDDELDWQSIVQAEYAVNCVIEKGAKIINCSFGCRYTSEEEYKKANILRAIPQLNDYDAYVESQKNAAERYSEHIAASMCALLENGYDVLLVQSAGNGEDNNNEVGVNALNTSFWAGITEETYEAIGENFTTTYEQLDEHILIVGGVENAYEDDTYSMCLGQNYGETVDICAPSVSIYSTLYQDKYGYMTGTSMAAPIVSGVAALVWSADPELGAAEVRQILLENYQYEAEGEFDGQTWTYPVVNARLAVEAALQKQWARTYREYIAEKYADCKDDLTFQMIYLDGDGIPEIYAYDAYVWEMVLLTYDHGTVNQWSGRPGGLEYLEKGNLFCYTTVFNPYVYQIICAIKDCKVSNIVEGSCKFAGTDKAQYSWNGQEVTEAAYKQLFAAAFDSSLARSVTDSQSVEYTYDEILKLLSE